MQEEYCVNCGHTQMRHIDSVGCIDLTRTDMRISWNNQVCICSKFEAGKLVTLDMTHYVSKAELAKSDVLLFKSSTVRSLIHRGRSTIETRYPGVKVIKIAPWTHYIDEITESEVFIYRFWGVVKSAK